MAAGEGTLLRRARRGRSVRTVSRSRVQPIISPPLTISISRMHPQHLKTAGVYSGVLGFIGVGGATCDLAIVIRSAVISSRSPSNFRSSATAVAGASPGPFVRVGAGGAIVALSRPEAELEEMRLKARAVLRAVGEAGRSRSPPQ